MLRWRLRWWRAISQDGLLGVDLVGVVVVVLSAEEEAELGVVLLLRFGHLLEFGTVSGHELGQFVDDVAKLLVRGRLRQVHGEGGGGRG